MRLEELTSPEVGALDRDRTVLILPLGSVEQHGNHMPLGTDTMLAHGGIAGGGRTAGKRGRAAAALVRIFGASHALCRQRHAQSETLMAVATTSWRRWSATASGASSSSTVMAETAASSTCSPRPSATSIYGHARIAALTYFQLAREAIAELRESEPGGMGHACEFETAMVQHIRPELVDMEKACVTYPDPGSRLPDDRPARRLGRSAPFSISAISRRRAPSATPRCRAREGCCLLRGGGRRTRRLHRGFPRPGASRSALDDAAAEGRRHRARLLRRAPRQHLWRASGGRADRRLRPGCRARRRRRAGHRRAGLRRFP